MEIWVGCIKQLIFFTKKGCSDGTGDDDDNEDDDIKDDDDHGDVDAYDSMS